MSMYYKFISKKPKMSGKLTRIYIPARILKKVKGKFVKIKINRDIEFIDKINEKRFVIPKKLIERIKFLNKNTINMKRIIYEKKVKRGIIKNKRLNLIALIPEKTRSGTPIKIKREKGCLICFCKSFNGSLREIKLNKDASLDFCRLLGYYQAEGAKEKRIRKRKGRQVVITNTNLDLISDFVKLSEEIIKPEIWKAEIGLKRITNKKVKLTKNRLIKLGILGKNIKIRTEEKLKDFSIRLFICSTLLSDIIINFMDTIRTKLTKQNLVNKNYLEIYKNFMQGLFAGDGNYNTYKNKKGGTHYKLIFYEGDKKYAEDYQKLLNKIGFDSKILKIKDKNLYIVKCVLNWRYLLLLQEMELFNYHKKHKESLINSINNHKRYKSHKYLISLKDNFNIKQICSIIKKDKTTCYNWIKSMIDENLIVKNKVNDWSISKEGKRVRGILTKVKSLSYNHQIL